MWRLKWRKNCLQQCVQQLCFLTTSVYSIAAAEEKPVTQTSSRATNVLKASDNDDKKTLKSKEAAKKN